MYNKIFRHANEKQMFITNLIDALCLHLLTKYKYTTTTKQLFFFGKCFKNLIFPQISFFLFKAQSFRLIMENNFIQMAVSAGLAVAYTIGPIFKHIIDGVQLYFTNGFTNIVL